MKNTEITTELGYTFYEPTAWGGYSRLDICIFTEPTLRHYDPEMVRFCVVNEINGSLEHIAVTHPWRGSKRFRLCVGHITLRDRKGKVVESFSLGGDLEIATYKTHTHCQITSSAPIIKLIDTQDIGTLLAVEFESWLARQRASWAADDSGFERRLTHIEPFALFLAGLVELNKQLSQAPAKLKNARYWKIFHETNRIVRLLQDNGSWSVSPPTLNDLLCQQKSQ